MILVTGATGHLGNVIVNDLIEKGYTVRAFVLPRDDIQHIKDLPVEIVYGNVLDYDSVLRAVKDCKLVIHTAAIVSIGNEFSPKSIFDVNVNGLENVLKASFKENIDKFIYISSIHAFNEWKHEVEINEDTKIIAKEHKIPYARSKALALEVVALYRKQGLYIDVLYPTGIIGPYDYRKNNNALRPIRQYLNSNGKRLFYFDAGYDFVDVRDVSHVVLKMLDIKTYNNEFIISGEHITLKEIYTAIGDIVSKKIKLTKVPNWLVNFGVYFAYFFNKIFRIKMPITPQALKILSSKHKTNSTKLKMAIDYKPRCINESLEDSVNFIISQN